MICVEWISFEIGAFVVGSINEIELAINAVLINVLTLAFMVSHLYFVQAVFTIIIPYTLCSKNVLCMFFKCFSWNV